MVKNRPAGAGDAKDSSLTPGSERCPGVGNGNASPVFLPGKFHGQWRLVGYSPLGLQRIRHNCAHTQSGVPVFKNLSQIS